jgi:hypothetical protein
MMDAGTAFIPTRLNTATAPIDTFPILDVRLVGLNIFRGHRPEHRSPDGAALVTTLAI